MIIVYWIQLHLSKNQNSILQFFPFKGCRQANLPILKGLFLRPIDSNIWRLVTTHWYIIGVFESLDLMVQVAFFYFHSLTQFWTIVRKQSKSGCSIERPFQQGKIFMASISLFPMINQICESCFEDFFENWRCYSYLDSQVLPKCTFFCSSSPLQICFFSWLKSPVRGRSSCHFNLQGL